jgi:hypothetical protein
VIDSLFDFIRYVQFVKVHESPISVADILSTNYFVQYTISGGARERKIMECPDRQAVTGSQSGLICCMLSPDK